jgi:aminodeoxyfutalosine deaminase
MLRGQIPPPSSFPCWIRAINERKALLREEDYLGAIAEGFLEARRFGTTSVVNLEAFPQLIQRVGRVPIRTWWCAEMIDVRERVDLDAALNFICGSEDELARGGLAPHAPFTASADLYRECSRAARRNNLLLTTHLAESREEMEMFRDAKGPLFDFLQSIGRPTEDCGSETPFAGFLRRIEPGDHWLLAHLNELAEEDFELLRGRRFHVVHCPRSHRYFAHAPFPLGRLREAGMNVCLGTDSLASNSDFSLFAEMRALISLSPRERLEMVTTNPARALGQADRLGRIRQGCYADLITVPLDHSGLDPLEQIVAFDQPVPWIMVNGSVLS